VLFYRFLSPETDRVFSMGQHFDSHSYQSAAVPQPVLVLIPAINLMSSVSKQHFISSLGMPTQEVFSGEFGQKNTRL
jgi:hypothetical protein